MNKKILMIDDEYDVLSAYKRNLRKDFIVSIAGSGNEALQILSDSEEFAAVITDFRMPGMNGIELLEKVQRLYPDTIRIIITGHADLQLAMDAVNKGNIFRFLTKPVPTEDLISIIKDSVEFFRLKKSEKELLNNTFKGVINIFIELMQQVHPYAFNQIKRSRELGKKIAEDMAYKINWEFDITFLLSKIGFIAMPADAVEKYLEGMPLDKSEEKIINTYPEIGFSLLNKIPRLENIAEAIKYQNINFDGSNAFEDKKCKENLPFLARVIKVVNDYDFYLQQLKDSQEALFKLQENNKYYDPKILDALSVIATSTKINHPILSIGYRQLKIGMLLIKDVKDEKGNLLLRKGTEITDLLLMRLLHAAKIREIQEPLLVIEPYRNNY